MIDRWCIVFLAMFFGLVETAHFGWNMFPKSDAEMICDGITALLFALSFIPKGRTVNGPDV